jgi:prepilin-type N-terminal cleavage/methylation domain-containing protein
MSVQRRGVGAERAGFTLIEVMIALVVSGLVASLAYAAAQAGFDTDARVSEYRDGLAREGVVRAILSDALRHQVDGVRGGSAVFMLDDRVDTEGRDADSVTFVTRGIVSPMGASARWQLTVWRDGTFLRVAGAPLEDAPGSAQPFAMRLEQVTAFDVRALGRGLAARWSARWADADQAPDAFALRIAAGGADAEPLVVRRGLERAP